MLFSINPLTTIGHGEYGADLKSVHPEMMFMVDLTGKVSPTCACPLSPYWRELMVQTYRLYAGTQPVRLWIEDDFRYFNHGSVRLGCFCPRHLEAFAKRTGRRLTREALVEALLRPGPADPVRREWMCFLGETLVETAGLIARAVHAVSPETQLGWMSTNASVMEMCGTDVGGILNALSDGRQAAIRMSTMGYIEQGWRDLYAVDESLKRVMPLLPSNTVRCIEVETFPHSLFSKSAAMLRAQMTWAGILGATNHTLNIFDYLGSPMSLTPTYGRLLAACKAELNAFAPEKQARDVPVGIGLAAAPMMPAAVQVREGATWHEWAVRENGWTTPLRAFGMPVVYDNEQAVTALSGQALRAFDRAGIDALFARGVLLDGVALEVLCDMGYTALAGVEIADQFPAWSRPIGPEELTDPEFGGAPQAYVWASLLRPGRILNPLSGSKVVSRIVDTAGQPLFPGFVLYENALGGRVASCPFDMGGSGLDPSTNRERPSFYSEYRKRQIQSIVRWLGRGRAPLVVEAQGWVLPHRADRPGSIRVSAMNLNADAWEGVGMRIGTDHAVRSIRVADITGRWRMLDCGAWGQQQDDVTLQMETQVPPGRVVAAELTLASDRPGKA